MHTCACTQVASSFSHMLNLHNLTEEVNASQTERAVRLGEVRRPSTCRRCACKLGLNDVFCAQAVAGVSNGARSCSSVHKGVTGSWGAFIRAGLELAQCACVRSSCRFSMHLLEHKQQQTAASHRGGTVQAEAAGRPQPSVVQWSAVKASTQALAGWMDGAAGVECSWQWPLVQGISKKRPKGAQMISWYMLSLSCHRYPNGLMSQVEDPGGPKGRGGGGGDYGSTHDWHAPHAHKPHSAHTHPPMFL